MLRNKRTGFLLGPVKQVAWTRTLDWSERKSFSDPGYFDLVLITAKQTQISNATIIWIHSLDGRTTIGLGQEDSDIVVNDIVFVFCLLKERKKKVLWGCHMKDLRSSPTTKEASLNGPYTSQASHSYKEILLKWTVTELCAYWPNP